MLHERADVRHQLMDDVFASADAALSLPKYTMPDDEHDSRLNFCLVVDELLLDGNSRQNLATFCQT